MRYKILFLLVIATGLHSARGESENFAFLAQRQMQADITLAEVQTNFISDRYQDLIDDVLYRQQKTQDLILELNKNLVLKEIVDPAYKTCIQRHKSDMYTKGQAEAKFTACQSLSKEKQQKYLLDIDTSFRAARNIANVQWPLTVESCRSSNASSPEECIVAKAETYFWAFNDNMNDVQDGTEMNHGLSSVIARNSMECSFYVEKRILMKIGGTLQMIDVCLEEMHLPPISGEMLFG